MQQSIQNGRGDIERGQHTVAPVEQPGPIRPARFSYAHD